VWKKLSGMKWIEVGEPTQCRQFNDIKIERIFDQIQNSPFFSFCAKKAQKDTDHF